MSRSSQNTTPTIRPYPLPTTATPTSDSPLTTSPPELYASHPFPSNHPHGIHHPQPRRQPSFSPSTPSGTTTTAMSSQPFLLPAQPNSASSNSGTYPSSGLGLGVGPLETATPPPMSPAKKSARPVQGGAGLGETSRNISSSSLQHLYDALRASAGGANSGLGYGLNGMGKGNHRGSTGTGPLGSPSIPQGNGTADEGDGFGIVSPRGGVQPLPRSRRSSVALAVSVSLASRSRSHTPVQQDGATHSRMGSPPVSPGRNGNATFAFGTMETRRSREGRSSRLGEASHVPTTDQRKPSGGLYSGIYSDGSSRPRMSHSRAPSGDAASIGVVHDQEMHWEEAFETDAPEDDEGVELEHVETGGNEDASMRSATLVDEAGRDMRKLVLDSLVEEDDVSMPGSASVFRHEAANTASEVDSTRQPSRSTSFGSISAVDQDMVGDDDDDQDGFGNVFKKGDRFGAGVIFEGEEIEELDPVARLAAKGRTVPGGPVWPIAEPDDRGKTFEVVKTLGSGSYAVVYLVREIGGSRQEYALKCLSKRDLEEDSLDIQLFEATIHMSLPKHDNIVTLYQTLQTGKWLFLLMEMCPGEDLFYWLEHSRDSPPESVSSTLLEPIPTPGQHVPPLSSSNLPSSAVPFSSSAMMAGMRHSPMALSSSPALTMSKSHLSHMDFGAGHHGATPTTPSLLAAYSANSLLAYRRLRLIASMFVQMCEAVSICHQAGVSHRDIKPENFICCDSEDLASNFPDSARIGAERKKVIVKLTDFGLATTEENSGDVECGSRPYMAYECRNELGPDYAPRPADVWSLGIVLLNMLFHRNPWTDPAPGNKNFDGFLDNPVDFLLTRFTGIGREVATYLAHRVFALRCEQRVTAGELAIWAKDLPAMITGRKLPGASRTNGSQPGPREKDQLDFTKSPVEAKGHSSTFSQFSSLSQTAPRDQPSGGSSDNQTTHQSASQLDPEGQDCDDNETADPDDASRTASAIKRKKRGARKGKAAQAAAAALLAGMPDLQLKPTVLPTPKDELLTDLAEASQALAREVSSFNKATDRLTVDEFPRLGQEAALVEAKKSKWKGIANLSSGNPELQALAQKVKAKEGGHLSAPGKLQGIGKTDSQHRAANHLTASATSHTPSLTFGASSTSSLYPSNHSTHSHTSSINDLDTWRRPPASVKANPPPTRPAPPRKAASHGWTGLLEETSALALASQIAQPLAQSAGVYPVPSRTAPSIASTASNGSGHSFFYRRSNASTSTFATTISSRSASSQVSLPPKPMFTMASAKQSSNLKQEVSSLPYHANQLEVDFEHEQTGNLLDGKPASHKLKAPKALDLSMSSLEIIAERPSDASPSDSPPTSAALNSGNFLGAPALARSDTVTSRKSSIGSMATSPNTSMTPAQAPSGQKLKQQISKMFTGLKREKAEVGR